MAVQRATARLMLLFWSKLPFFLSESSITFHSHALLTRMGPDMNRSTVVFILTRRTM